MQDGFYSIRQFKAIKDVRIYSVYYKNVHTRNFINIYIFRPNFKPTKRMVYAFPSPVQLSTPISKVPYSVIINLI